MPERIQRQRTAGWRMPEGVVYVGRPGRWGNPFSAMDVGEQYPSLTDQQLAGMLVANFRDLIRAGGRLDLPNWRRFDGVRVRAVFRYPSLEEIRAELAGRDLACWCPTSSPCHADVLLELANEVAPCR